MDTVLFFVYSNKYICANRIEGARRYAENTGWNIQVIERNSVDRPLDIKGIIDFWKPIGIIAECGGGVPEVSRKSVGNVPIVYLDEDPNGDKGRALYVNSDSSLVGEIAAKEMLSLNMPHYAFVGWRMPRFWSEERRAAFESALRLHGRDCMTFACPPKVSALRRRELLNAWVKSLPKPCGVFAVNDPVGEEILATAVASGISVPDELAVIGVDDDPVICERTKPSLSSIRLDFEQGGYICAELLDRRLKDSRFTHAALKFEPVFVNRRQSTRRSALTDSRVAKAMEYIRRNACDGIGTQEVAREMDLSRRMAEIVFKRNTGRTIHDEITSVRMERVERLLANPRQDIAAVAGLCGWASESVLRKSFKERHGGLSMREWRKKNSICH
ncbi:MAG: substrate-binding domain-containing protein [Kiritimatiellae bacterium]|nr:substrate-binding domain-containing protein [Kiritimatiellia bacterium]